MNIVLLIPDSVKDKANALGEAMGWGPNNYSIAVSADGFEPATYWGLNIAQVTPTFLSLLSDAAQGQMPPGLDFPPQDFAEIMTNLIVETDKDFNTVLAEHNLLLVESSE